MQANCVRCHGDALKRSEDSHPKSKFTDPRNADRVAILDARYCVACHVEHKQEMTDETGVTLPKNYCVKCHYDIAKDRPSHKGMDFMSCASGGCHNYHDNRALYEDFLLKHLNEPATLQTTLNPTRNFAEFYRTSQNIKAAPLHSKDADAQSQLRQDDRILYDWATTTHARSGVNCSACHRDDKATDPAAQWHERPGPQVCTQCHDDEYRNFSEGRHGMRLAQNLSPMQPQWATIPMNAGVHSRKLSCVTCHRDHDFNTRFAAVEACLECHADRHSKAYQSSAHYRLWRDQTSGLTSGETGVSCATCHMPRLPLTRSGRPRVLVQHNQNDNLRPNEKMIRSVCLNCHGLAFAIDALADPALVAQNFNGQPSRHIASIEMAVKRVKDKPKKAQSLP